MQNSKIYTTILKEISILYVEDELHTRSIISEILDNFCANVLVASNGKEALEVLKSENIDLIITDLEMPQMDGISFIKELRKTDRKTSVIILSAYSTQEYLFASINLRIEAFILKPISYTKLKDALFNVAQTINDTENIFIKISHNLSYDRLNGSLIYNNKKINLQKKERYLMNLLVEKKGNLVSYEMIEETLWNSFDVAMTPTALRTVVKKLRKKVDQELIENVSGTGYKLIIE